MKNVYVVIWRSTMGGCPPQAVFSTEEKAREFILECDKLHNKEYETNEGADLYFEEMSVDTEKPE